MWVEKKINKRGFSLIEMMIVVAVVATIAAIAIPKYNVSKLKANRSECFHVASGIAKKASMFMSKTEQAPCIIGTTANFGTGCLAAGDISQIEFPINGVLPNDNADFYYSYNIAPGGVATNGNRVTGYFPNDPFNNPNKAGERVVTVFSDSRAYPGENYVISCLGWLDLEDLITIRANGKIHQRSDGITGERFPVGPR